MNKTITKFAGMIGIVLLGLCVGLFRFSSADEATAQQLEFTSGVVVLRDGRVFPGRISNVAGGYRVDSRGTYVIVPFGKVDVTARSLNEAYIALRDRVLKPTADNHLTLAEWCLKNNLVGSAKSEVTEAIKLEPLRQESRALLLAIDKRLKTSEENSERSTGPAMTVDGFLRSEEKTSAGLSREVHQEYARRIQPLILNKCGNAHCHGQATETAFRLRRIQRGVSGNQLLSQSNLDQVLNQLDLAQPSQSPLLMKAVAVDAQHRKIFLGSRGGDQFKLLSDWVKNVAAELPSVKKQSSRMNAQRTAARQIQLTAAEVAEDPPRNGVRENTLLQEVRQQSQPDPFDPDVFNRRVHGASASELKGRAIPKSSAKTDE